MLQSYSLRNDLSSETKGSVGGATIFNLTRLRLGNNKPIHIVVGSPIHLTHALSHSVLYTFCNMNATVANTIRAASIATLNNDESDGMMGDDPLVSSRTNDDKKTSDPPKKWHKICQKTPRNKNKRPRITGGKVTTTPAPRVDYQPLYEACKRHKLVIALDFFPPAFIVLHPKYYDVGQCKGMCAQVTDFCRLDALRTGRALLLNRNVNRTHVNYVMCAPHKMASMPIMYYMNNAFVTNVIPNASVRTCRCV
ncbi:hypothetical protein Btru_023906 [Bulinus truncatus]|nr:hypothetical protein Btru_023906 [Bulinus truncatus]